MPYICLTANNANTCCTCRQWQLADAHFIYSWIIIAPNYKKHMLLLKSSQFHIRKWEFTVLMLYGCKSLLIIYRLKLANQIPFTLNNVNQSIIYTRCGRRIYTLMLLNNVYQYMMPEKGRLRRPTQICHNISWFITAVMWNCFKLFDFKTTTLKWFDLIFFVRKMPVFKKKIICENTSHMSQQNT